jgi:hypothetical protein
VRQSETWPPHRQPRRCQAAADDLTNVFHKQSGIDNGLATLGAQSQMQL